MLPTLKKGDCVIVYQDPITCLKPEGKAVITSVLRCETWNDAAGNPIHRCKVRFVEESIARDNCAYERDVSVKAKHETK